jgi:hypothetical protein
MNNSNNQTNEILFRVLQQMHNAVSNAQQEAQTNYNSNNIQQIMTNSNNNVASSFLQNNNNDNDNNNNMIAAFLQGATGTNTSNVDSSQLLSSLVLSLLGNNNNNNACGSAFQLPAAAPPVPQAMSTGNVNPQQPSLPSQQQPSSWTQQGQPPTSPPTETNQSDFNNFILKSKDLRELINKRGSRAVPCKARGMPMDHSSNVSSQKQKQEYEKLGLLVSVRVVGLLQHKRSTARLQ